MKPIEDWLKLYSRKGFHLFPIHAESKKPCIGKNLEKATTDMKILNRWKEKFPGCNWGLSLAKSGFVALDIDKEGLTAWDILCIENGEPETLTAQSGSGIGLHYIFKAKEDVRYRGKIKKLDGIHIKHNGYVCVAPSTHSSGNFYKWINNTPISDVPDWLELLIEKKEELTKREKIKLNEDLQYYNDVIIKLKSVPLDYDDWVACGMGIYTTFEGSKAGLDLWLELTSGESFKPGDYELAADKWESFEIGERTFGTVVHIAREKGLDLPNYSLQVDKIAFAQTELNKKESESKHGDWFEDESGRKLSISEKIIVNKFNLMGYCVLNHQNEGTIARVRKEKGVKSVNLIDPRKFDISTAHYFLKKYNKDGSHKLTPANEVWLESSKKTTYSKIVFKPTSEKNELNLWSKIPCKPIDGDISDIMFLIRDLICGGDVKRCGYLLDWCAHLVQKPEIKSTVVPVIIGEQGTGKGLFTDGILAGILSIFYIRLDKPGIITEKFNVEQSRKFLTVLDESSWKGHHELRNVLKSLTGNDTMTVEEKFGGRYSIENYSRYIVTSNSIEAVNIEISNRRYLVLEMSTKKENGFYKKLWNDVKYGEACNHFYKFLKDRDISNFNPHEFPYELDTEGMNTKIKSLSVIGQFWIDLLIYDPKRVFRNPQTGFRNEIFLDKKAVFDEFKEFCKTSFIRINVNGVNFWLDTYTFLPELKTLTSRKRIGKERYQAIQISPTVLRRAVCRRLNIKEPDDLPADDDFIIDDYWVDIDEF